MQLELALEPVALHWGLAERGPLVWHAVIRDDATVSVCGERKVFWQDLPEWLPKFNPLNSCPKCAAYVSARRGTRG